MLFSIHTMHSHLICAHHIEPEIISFFSSKSLNGILYFTILEQLILCMYYDMEARNAPPSTTVNSLVRKSILQLDGQSQYLVKPTASVLCIARQIQELRDKLKELIVHIQAYNHLLKAKSPIKTTCDASVPIVNYFGIFLELKVYRSKINVK